MVYSTELDWINRALVSLVDRHDHDEKGDPDLAAAIDHLGEARALLGGEEAEQLTTAPRTVTVNAEPAAGRPSGTTTDRGTS